MFGIARPPGIVTADRLSRRRQPFDLPAPEAADQMVVHHSDRLHERIADRRADEAEAPRLQIAAQQPRSLGLRRYLTRLAPSILHRPAVDEAPEIRVEGAMLPLNGEH